MIVFMDERRRLQDLEDYDNEAAGREVGRIQRFFTSDNDRTEECRQRQSQERDQKTQLALLLANLAYEALYNDVLENLAETEDRLYNTMKKVADAAAKGDADAKKHLQRLIEQEEELRRIRQHMQDEDEPPTKDQLEDYQRRIDDINADLDSHSADLNSVKEQNSTPITGTSSTLDIPSI